MKNGLIGALLIAVSAIFGYAIASRCAEESKDFR